MRPEYSVCCKISKSKAGFTLIELGATLVIIALIVAAIISSLNMSSQAEMRSVISDLQSYREMYQTFYTQYKQAPGDMATAATVWPAVNVCTLGPTCNGDGDGIIEAIHGSSLDETLRAWKHLELAGIYEQGVVAIPAAYAGVLLVGSMSPKSKLDGAGYYMAGGSDIGGDTGGTVIASPWTDNRTNAVFLGQKSSSATSNGLTIGILTGKYAYNIDVKIDDGKQSSGSAIGQDTGKFRTRNDSAGGTTCISGGYVLTSSMKTCLVGYQLHDVNF